MVIPSHTEPAPSTDDIPGSQAMVAVAYITPAINLAVGYGGGIGSSV